MDVLFTRFINTMTQRPDGRSLLPVAHRSGDHAVWARDADEETRRDRRSQARRVPVRAQPGAGAGRLLPHYLNFRVYQMLLEAKASEHSARMVAMKNATDNAKQLIKDLTLEYNKMRQASITNELLEITTAQMALG